MSQPAGLIGRVIEMISASFPRPPALEGRIVRMEPLTAAHEDGLFAAADDPRIWQWMPYDAIESRERFHGWMTEALEASDQRREFGFVTVDRHSGHPIGSSRFLALRPEHRGMEIGWTWLRHDRWGTGANVESKLLLLEHAFGPMGCMRVEFKTDAQNRRSRAALAALPAQFEGIFRKHMLVRDGQLRDSAWYSIVDDEWPAVRRALIARLS